MAYASHSLAHRGSHMAIVDDGGRKRRNFQASR